MNVLEANTVAPEVTVTAPSLVPTPAPTAPVKVILPVPAVRPRVWEPSRVLLKRMLPAPAPVLINTPSVKVTPVVNEIKLLVVVMSPPRELAPAPFWMNVPTVVMSATLEVVKRPVLLTFIVVPIRLTPAPLMFRIVPVKSN